MRFLRAVSTLPLPRDTTPPFSIPRTVADLVLETTFLPLAPSRFFLA